MDPTLVLVLAIFMLACCASHCCCCDSHQDSSTGSSMSASTASLLLVLLLGGAGFLAFVFAEFWGMLVCGILLIPALGLLVMSIIADCSSSVPEPFIPSPTPPPSGFKHDLTNAALVAGVVAVVVPVVIGLVLVIEALSS